MGGSITNGCRLADVDEIWRRMRAGHSMKLTARALGLPTSTVRSYLVRCGGIRPGSTAPAALAG